MEQHLKPFVYLHVFRKSSTTGCEFEDGSDTRESNTEIYVIPDTELDDFYELTADDYGSQDYSYWVDYKEIAKIPYWELEEFYKALAPFLS